MLAGNRGRIPTGDAFGLACIRRRQVGARTQSFDEIIETALYFAPFLGAQIPIVDRRQIALAEFFFGHILSGT